MTLKWKTRGRREMTSVFENICPFKESDHNLKYFFEFIKISKHDESWELLNWFASVLFFVPCTILQDTVSIYLTETGSGFSASCRCNFSSVKIKSRRPMSRTTPRKTQLQSNPNCLNKSLNISKTITPRPFKPMEHLKFC